VEATRNLPHEIITLGFRMAKDIVHHTAPFHACDDMFNEDTDTGDHLVLGFVVGTPLLSSWFFLWLIGTNMIRFKAIPQKSPCACSLKCRPPLTESIELSLGLSQGTALQAEPLAMCSKALPFLSQGRRGGVTQGPQ
jgi:hypothetical protein